MRSLKYTPCYQVNWLIAWSLLVFSVQFIHSVVSWLWGPMDCCMPGFPVHQFPALAQTHVPWASDAIQLSHHLSSPSPPPFNLSQHRGPFQWVSSLHQVAKELQFQLQHQSFQWIFKTDFLEDGLVVSSCSPRDSQESSSTPQLRSIYSSAFSFLYGPTLFMVSIHDYQKSHSFGKTDFVGRVMSLLFNMLSRFVIAFLPRSKCILISWLQSPSAVILEQKKKKKVCHCFHYFWSICHEVMGPDAMILF